jgi:cytochrome b involved in lipid metabolism
MKKPKKIERAREKRLQTAIKQVIGPRSILEQIKKLDHVDEEPDNDMLQEEEEMIIYSRRMEYLEKKEQEAKEKRQRSKFRMVTEEELAAHFTRHDAWVCLDGAVYDITGFLKNHPKGGQFLMYAGKDASENFGKFSQLF